MKKLGIAFFFLLFMCVSAYADTTVVVVQPAAEAACDNVTDSQTSAASGDYNPGIYADYQSYGTNFVAAGTGTYTVCAIGLYLEKNGTPNFNIKACLYNTAGSGPTTEIDCTEFIDADTYVSASETELIFTGLSASITNGTEYCVVLLADDNGSGSNYIEWFYYDTGDTDYWIYRDTYNGTTEPSNPFSNYVDNEKQFKFKLYSQ